MHQKLFSQRFTVAEFSSIICFVFIFRCSIFKVQFAVFSLMLHNSLAATACLLYHIFLLLSSTFSNFFEVFLLHFFLNRFLADSPTIISQTFGFVKGFCKSFLSFFSGLCDSMIVADLLVFFCRPSDSSVIIPPTLRFVNPFSVTSLFLTTVFQRFPMLCVCFTQYRVDFCIIRL